MQIVAILFFLILIILILVVSGCVFEQRFSKYSRESWFTESKEIPPAAAPKKRSVLLIHGYGDSPFAFRALGESLAAEGYHVSIPLVPGQSRSEFAFKRGRYSARFYIDWISGLVEKEYSRFNRKPFLVGFSMGGTLASIGAATGRAEKLVLLAPYFRLARSHRLAEGSARYIRFMIPVLPKRKKGNLNSPEGYKLYFPGSRMQSIKNFLTLTELARHAEILMSEIRCPVLLIGSENDRTVTCNYTRELFSSHQNCEIREYPRSNHVLLFDYDNAEIEKAIFDFINA